MSIRAGGEESLGTWSWNRFSRLSRVYEVFEFLAGLEEGNFLSGNVHAVTGFGIATHAGFALPRAKAAKAANFDLVTGAQRLHDAVKDGLHDHLAVLAGELDEPGNFFDQVSFGHKRITLPVSLGFWQPSGWQLFPEIVEPHVIFHQLGARRNKVR